MKRFLPTHKEYLCTNEVWYTDHVTLISVGESSWEWVCFEKRPNITFDIICLKTQTKFLSSCNKHTNDF